MKRSARVLLAVLVLALPWQGAMAATRLCMSMGSAAVAQPAVATASIAGHDHALEVLSHDRAGQGHHAASTSGQGDGADAGHGDHAASTCKLCSACCLTVAVAPPGLTVFPSDATGGLFRPVDAVAPPAIAGGFERPPRTM